MPKKKSIKKAAQRFREEADEISQFVTALTAHASDAQVTWLHDHAIIRLYRSFENLVLEALVGAINNNTETISDRTGIKFPKHLTDEVCGYLITGGGYFDFKGRDGLIKTLKSYVPADHYLVTISKKAKYKEPLERLSALRNFAAHDSEQSKQAAKKAVGAERLSSAGAWLKKNGRLTTITDALKDMATEIEGSAPY